EIGARHVTPGYLSQIAPQPTPNRSGGEPIHARHTLETRTGSGANRRTRPSHGIFPAGIAGVYDAYEDSPVRSIDNIEHLPVNDPMLLVPLGRTRIAK
ncbi:MAG: hypothetical protein P4L90_01535, partial [Rhodopila sp.]|nr:hypothetical protein [Rhodopila sp.]